MKKVGLSLILLLVLAVTNIFTADAEASTIVSQKTYKDPYLGSVTITTGKVDGIINSGVYLESNKPAINAVVNLWKENTKTKQWELIGTREGVIDGARAYDFFVGGKMGSSTPRFYVQTKLYKSDGTLIFNRSGNVFTY
jgi:hypothetical protein